MTNFLTVKRVLLCLATFLYLPTLLHAEVLHRQFSVRQTADTEGINGQIDWPSGALERWAGPIVVLVSGGRPHDRNGWLVLASESAWAGRLPFQDLSVALVKEGMAVVRFDNPGVRKPELKCRDTVLKRGITNDAVRRRCMDVRVLARFTVERYQRSIERMLLHVERMLPAAQGELVLFGFSEGLMHAAAIADRGRLKLRGLASIGSPAERMELTTHWQAVDRMLELLPAFDANADGIVSNEEIREGYKKGIANVMGMEGWLSPDGHWDRQNQAQFKSRLDKAYEMFRYDMNTGPGPGKLQWLQQTNGVLVPDVNDALWNFLFYGQISPVDVMQRRGLPGLFMWGDGDTQVSVNRQVALVDQTIKDGANIRYLRFPGRYHLLSTRQDFDWLETPFMPAIAREVSAFLGQLPAIPSKTAASLSAHPSERSLPNPDSSGGVPGSR